MPTVVFVHGVPGDARTFSPVAVLLAPTCRAVTYTQRGFSGAEADEPFSIEAHTADLIALIEGRREGPVALVGWSYGGEVALRAALARPDLVDRLLLYDPSLRDFPASSEDRAAFEADVAAMFGPVLGVLASGGPEAALRVLIDATGGEGYFDRQAPAIREIHLDNAHVLPRLFSAPPPPPLSVEALASLRVPCMVLWGERSRPVFSVPARALAAALPPGRHQAVPGAGHLWPEAAPAAFTDRVRSWALQDPPRG